MAEAPKQQKKRKVLSEETKKRKRESTRIKGQSRINIGPTFTRWRELKEEEGFSTDAALALFLLDYYLRTKSENRREQPAAEKSSSRQPAAEKSSSTETCESVPHECTMMSSTDENGKESVKNDAACQRLNIEDDGTTNNQSENKENRDIREDEDEEFITLSVGDGRYLVDLGSSSEFIVDEECILQLFRTCRECNRPCTYIRKHVQGLKLVVNQACSFCPSHCKWTNLPDDDEDFQINGKDAAHGQTHLAKQ